MGVQERKQRARQERENLILDISLKMLVETGYPGLVIDRIAEEIEYSKGTVYQHFSCKEDIIVGLLCRTMAYEMQVLERALSTSSVPREQIMAMALYLDHFSSRYPGHNMQRMLFNDIHIWNRGHEERRRLINDQVMREIALAGEVVQQAYANGDLDTEVIGPGEAFYGVVSIALGNDEMKRIRTCLGDVGDNAPMLDNFFDNRGGTRVHRVMQAYLNGIAWKPVCTSPAWAEELLERIPSDVEQLIPFPAWSYAE